jgi:hypothetical protein
MGNHARVRGLKTVNWGTNAASRPCFAIAGITGETSTVLNEFVDVGIEGCIAVQPATSAAGGVITAIHAGGNEDAATNSEAYGKGPYIRNCFVDCDSPSATAEFHGLSVGWCNGGIIQGNQIHNTQYGGPYQDKASSRTVIVADNFYRNVARGGFWNLGRLNPSSPTALTNLVQDLAYDATGKTALATSSSTHYLQIGERVKISTSGAPDQFKGISSFGMSRRRTNFDIKCFRIQVQRHRAAQPCRKCLAWPSSSSNPTQWNWLGALSGSLPSC